MTPIGLALHTTTGELGVALVNNQGLYRCQSWNLGRQLANEIQLKLAEFIFPLAWQDLDFISVAKGPGSYTSTRIGVVTAKTLAQQLQVPVYGVSTLMTIAWYYHQKLEKGQYIAVEIKAHNEDIFGAIYQFVTEEKELKVIVPEKRFTQEEWEDIIENNKKAHNTLMKIDSPEKIAFTVESLLEIALIRNMNYDRDGEYNWQNLTVFYE